MNPGKFLLQTAGTVDFSRRKFRTYLKGIKFRFYAFFLFYKLKLFQVSGFVKACHTVLLLKNKNV